MKHLKKNIRILFAVTGVVMIWRGMWQLMDMYLFPGQPLLSSITSVVIGITILLLDDFLLNELGHGR